jgi:hypothetical protein
MKPYTGFDRQSWDLTIQWLLHTGGAVVRYRTAVELLGEAEDPGDVLALSEVQRWLNLLGTGPVHHGRDAAAENCLAKLAEYGLQAGIPTLDEKVLPYCRPEACKTDYDHFILLPFLIRLGYGEQPVVKGWFQQRLHALIKTADLGQYDIYMEDADKPPSVRDKRIYKPEFYQEYILPSCYDFYALAYAYDVYPQVRPQIDAVVAYFFDARYQTTPGGYLWNAALRRHYAAGRGYLATFPLIVEVPAWQAAPSMTASGTGGMVYPDAARLLLYMEAGAHLPKVRHSQWLQLHLEHLNGYQTPQGRFAFPRGYLLEREGYYLYSGSHMGLAENRRNREWVEVESTFRMLRLRTLTDRG